MAEDQSRLLTTGQAAARLSVRPDTVLKWIRKGRLTARKTEGGHNRIDPTELSRLLEGGAQGSSPNPTRPLRCFEYFSENGELREDCSRCIVYCSRATRCFEAQKWLSETGSSRTCPGSCDSCSFYRRAHGLAERVLVVSADEGLREALDCRASEDLILRFSSGAYNASTVVGSFLPGVVVVDQDLPAEEWKELILALETDERIPWVRIVVALNSQAAIDQFPHSKAISEWLVKPIAFEDLAGAVRSLEVEMAR